MANKRLGQHFLNNPDILRRVADALLLQSGDTVIEIGPGRGALTREIIARLQDCKIARFIGIEKDEKLARELARKFQITSTKLQIVEGDALKVLLEITSELSTNNYKLVGNIPYYITGKLFRVLGELEHKPEIVVLMIQKEVAERVSAKPPKMNLLAASVQIWAEVEMLFEVSRKEFRPMPNVDSAVIRLRLKTQDKRLKNDYYKLIKILFKQPRKTILNNLSEGLKRPKEGILPILRALGLDERSRPQNLSIELITKLLEPIS